MAATGTELPMIEKAKQISVFQNGDAKFPGKRIILNQKRIPNFEVFLDHVTDALRPRFGCVQRLYTPVGGHRIRDLNSVIKQGESFVAAGKERFQRLGYLEIEVLPRRRAQKGSIDIKPVRHSRIQTSGRIRKIRTDSIIIYVHSNGNDLEGPHRIQLRPREQGSWEMVLDAIKERVSLPWGGAIRRLCSLEGRPIHSVHEIENFSCYVACGCEKYARRDYEHPKPLMHSPRQDKRPHHGVKLVPLSQNQRTSKKGSQNTSENRTPDSNHGSMNSRPRKARRNQVKKEDQVIHERPVAYKRNGKNKEVNYDQDPGGVFRAQQENPSTRGAPEITEDRETRVDVPVDQRRAEVVEEERIDYGGDQAADRNEASPSHSIKAPSPLANPEPISSQTPAPPSETEEPEKGGKSPSPVEEGRMSTPVEDAPQTGGDEKSEVNDPTNTDGDSARTADKQQEGDINLV